MRPAAYGELKLKAGSKRYYNGRITCDESECQLASEEWNESFIKRQIELCR